MDNLKKFIASVTAVAVFATNALTGVAHGVELDDPEFDKALNWMSTSGLTKYDTTDDFMPYGTLNREQAAKFYAEFADKSLGLEKDTSKDCNFSDLGEADYTLVDSIEKACQMGLVKGSNGKYMPKDEFTKAQAITVLVRAINQGEKLDEDMSPWYTEYYTTAVQMGLVDGEDNSLNSLDREVTRYETALMLYRAKNKVSGEDSDENASEDGSIEDLLGGLLGENEDTSEDDSADQTDDDTENVSDDEDTSETGETDEDTSEDDEDTQESNVEGSVVEVSLNPNTPAAQSIPQKGRVRFATIDIAAGEEDVDLESIELERKGLGDREDISRVWLEKDNQRVSSRQTVRRDETVDIRMDRNFVVKAGEVVSLDLIVNMDSDSTAGEHKFVIDSKDAIQASAQIEGSFPIATNTMSTSSYEVATLTIVGVEEQTDSSDATYNVGEKDRILGEFDMLNNHDDRDIGVRRITMRQNGDGDVASSLDNLGLYVDGQEITKDVIVNDREVTFVMDKDVDYTNIDEGNNEYVEIRADIIGSETKKEDYQFEIRRTDDVYAIENKNDFATEVEFETDSENYAGRYIVEGGDLRFARDTDVSTSESYAPGSSDVTLLSAKMSVDEPVVAEDGVTLDATIKDDGTSIDSGSSAAYMEEVFSSLKLVVDGQVVATHTPDGENTDILFESTFDVHEDSTVQVQANVRSNIDVDAFKDTSSSLSKYEFEIDGLSSSDFEDLRYIRSDLEADISGSVDGVTVTIEQAEINVSKNDGLSDENVVQGAKDVILYGFRIREKDVADVRINGLDFTFATGDSNSSDIKEDDIQNIRLYRDGKELAINSAGDFNFNSLSEVIDQNQRSNFKLVADLSSNIGKENIDKYNDDDDHSDVDTKPKFNITNIKVDARDLSSNSTMDDDDAITNSDNEGATFTVQQFGGFDTLAKHTDSADQSILVPSDSTQQVYKLEMESQYDDIKIEDLVFENVASSNKIDFSSALKNAELEIDGETYEGYYDGKDKIKFDNIDAVLKSEETTNVDVKLAFHDVDDEYGKKVSLKINKDDSELESESTGIEVTDYDVPTESDTHMLAKTKPTVALKNAGGAQEATFSITADETNSLDVSSLTFEAGSDFADEIALGNIENELEIDFGSNDNVSFKVSNVSSDKFTVEFDEDYNVTAGSEVEVELNSLKAALTNTVDGGDNDYDRRLRIVGLKYHDGNDNVGQYYAIDDSYNNVGLSTDRSEYTYEELSAGSYDAANTVNSFAIDSVANVEAGNTFDISLSNITDGNGDNYAGDDKTVTVNSDVDGKIYNTSTSITDGTVTITTISNVTTVGEHTLTVNVDGVEEKQTVTVIMSQDVDTVYSTVKTVGTGTTLTLDVAPESGMTAWIAPSGTNVVDLDATDSNMTTLNGDGTTKDITAPDNTGTYKVILVDGYDNKAESANDVNVN